MIFFFFHSKIINKTSVFRVFQWSKSFFFILFIRSFQFNVQLYNIISDKKEVFHAEIIRFFHRKNDRHFIIDNDEYFKCLCHTALEKGKYPNIDFAFGSKCFSKKKKRSFFFCYVDIVFLASSSNCQSIVSSRKNSNVHFHYRFINIHLQSNSRFFFVFILCIVVVVVLLVLIDSIASSIISLLLLFDYLQCTNPITLVNV